MSKIIEAISGLEDLDYLSPASPERVEKAEHDLELTFADDFKEYVQSYGVISAKGMELTGITTAIRLDVVSVTMAERKMSSIPQTMYVIENIAIDGVLILQNSTGEVYAIAPHKPPQKICDSLAEYISLRNHT